MGKYSGNDMPENSEIEKQLKFNKNAEESGLLRKIADQYNFQLWASGHNVMLTGEPRNRAKSRQSVVATPYNIRRVLCTLHRPISIYKNGLSRLQFASVMNTLKNIPAEISIDNNGEWITISAKKKRCE